tara:strand:+ start:10347 stop:11750 length:1404 start_codon:yes stop_codon:yes gene_type:complete
MAEPTKLTWDKEKANSLYETYRQTWNKSVEFGISGKPDASTGQPNSKTLLDTILNHGGSRLSRKDKGWFGAQDIITELEMILDEEDVFTDDVDDLKDLIERMEKLEKSSPGPDCRNPRNIPFHTITDFKPSKEGKDAIIVRDVVYGHFLTPAYWEYRKNKASTDKPYNISKPQSNWTSKEPNRSRPPFWQALFGPENSLLILLKEVLILLEDIEIPPGPISVDFRFNKRSVTGLANLPAMQEYVWALVENPSIFPSGKSRKPMPTRLNQLANTTLIRLSSKKDIEEMSKIATITIQTEEGKRNIRLDEIPGWKKIKELKVSWPSSNKFLRRLIREVMGDQTDTFQKPGSDPEIVKPGLMLKAVEFTAETVVKDIEDLVIEFFGEEYEITDLLSKLQPHFESANEFKKHDREILGRLFWTKGTILGQDISIEIIKWLKGQDISEEKEAEFFIKLRPFIDELEEYIRED